MALFNGVSGRGSVFGQHKVEKVTASPPAPPDLRPSTASPCGYFRSAKDAIRSNDHQAGRGGYAIPLSRFAVRSANPALLKIIVHFPPELASSAILASLTARAALLEAKGLGDVVTLYKDYR